MPPRSFTRTAARRTSTSTPRPRWTGPTGTPSPAPRFFKHEIDWLLVGDKARVDETLVGSDRLELDTLLSRVSDAAPGYEAVGWVWFLDEARSDIVYLVEKDTSDWSYLLLNQYTGDILAAPRPLDHFLTDWLLELHFNFLLHDAGLAVTSLFAVMLLVLGVTGLILYRGFWKRLFTLRWNSRLVVYFSDLHSLPASADPNTISRRTAYPPDRVSPPPEKASAGWAAASTPLIPSMNRTTIGSKARFVRSAIP